MFEILSTKESILHIARQIIPDVDVEITNGSSTGVSCNIKNGKNIIVWDETFWNYIGQNMFALDTVPFDPKKDYKIITEYIHTFQGILYNHLSKRYYNSTVIKDFFLEQANKNNYFYFNKIYPEAINFSPWESNYQLSLYVCKLITLYHELAHIKFSNDINFKKENEENTLILLKDYLRNNSNYINSNLFQALPFGRSIDWAREILDEIKNGSNIKSDLLEELSADFFSICKTHATFFLNHGDILDINSLSNIIMDGVFLYYKYVTNYSYVCTFWDNIIVDYILKKGNFLSRNKSLRKLDEKILVRGRFYPLLICLLVYKLSKEKSDLSYVSFMDTVISNLEMNGLNDKWFDLAFGLTMCDENYNNILNGLFQKKSTTSFEKNLQSTTNSSTDPNCWLSLQYHNNKGVAFQEKRENAKALSEFLLCVDIATNYLGKDHRFTAREYNNVADVFLSMFVVKPSMNLLMEAKYYSETAIEIIDNTDDKNDYQATSILQNAGVVNQLFGNTRKAISYYERTRELKLVLFKTYNYSIAITDYSLAESYWILGDSQKALLYCNNAIEFFEKFNIKDNAYQKAQDLMLYLKSKKFL